MVQVDTEDEAEKKIKERILDKAFETEHSNEANSAMALQSSGDDYFSRNFLQNKKKFLNDCQRFCLLMPPKNDLKFSEADAYQESRFTNDDNATC